MRVIITGGSGLIGSALAADLLKDGHEVIALSRDPQGRRSHLPAGVRVEPWDGRSAQGWGHLAEGAWAIVNLAGENIGEKRWSEEPQASDRGEPGAGRQGGDPGSDPGGAQTEAGGASLGRWLLRTSEGGADQRRDRLRGQTS